MNYAQKLTVVGVLAIIVWIIFKNDEIRISQPSLQQIVSPNKSNREDPSPVTQKTVDNASSSISESPPMPQILEYAGTASDEVGNVSRITLYLSPDLTKASMGNDGANGPFLAIRGLAGGIYQFTEGTVLGIEFIPSSMSCTVYNSSGSYFCTLYRVRTRTDISLDTGAPRRQTMTDSSAKALSTP